MPSFYNGKRFFLTYPRCDKLQHELVSFLQSKGDLVYYIVARELHEDGMPHLHACIEFANIFRGNVRSLDWDGHHPNKQDPRNWNACKNYCKKDKDFVEGPEDYHLSKTVKSMDVYAECCAHSTQEGWYGFCVQHKISYQYAQWFWSRCHSNDATIRTSDVVGKLVPALDQLKWRDNWKTVVLIGPSGCGKTTWAKREIPKPSLFVSHIDQLKLFDKDVHKSVIFDDVDFKHYPRTSQIHLVDYDNPRAIHVRYGTAFIPASVPKVFTANVDPIELSDEAVRRRCYVIRVRTHMLVHENTLLAVED